MSPQALDTSPAPVGSHPGFRVIFRASGLSPLYMVQVVAFGFCIAGLGLAWHLGNAPRHPLTSSQAHMAWTMVLGLLAVVSPLAAWAYGRRLAVELQLSESRTLRVRDANLLGSSWRTISLDDITVAAVTQGDAAGESTLSPSRVHVAVRGDRDFTVPLGRNREQGERLVALLRG